MFNQSGARDDAKAVGKALSTINHSQTVMAAVKDYAKEMERTAKLAEETDQTRSYHIADMVKASHGDDPELQKLHEDRLAELQQEREKRVQMLRTGHGEVTEVQEHELLESVTKTELVVCHFFHRDFERCKIMDKHLLVLAKKHFKTRFIKLSAPDAPFFTVKLNIKMLPCVLCFKDGVSVDRVVGFDGLGGLDDFETDALEGRLIDCGAVVPVVQALQDADSRIDGAGGKVRKGFNNVHRTESDEDSDFD